VISKIHRPVWYGLAHFITGLLTTSSDVLSTLITQ